MASKKSNTEEGYMVRVRVTPHARKEVVLEKEGVWHIAVREPAEGNRANARITEILADRLGVSVSQVRMVTGARSRSKLIRITT